MAAKLIENYGLFWLWDNVHTGGGKGFRGRLLGHPKNAKKTHVDFCDQRGIYALYAGYEFVYAGQIGKRGLLTRLKEHRIDDLARRWDRFSFFGTRRVLDMGCLAVGRARADSNLAANVMLDQLEALLIYSTAPSLNNNRGRWCGASRYYQVRDSRLGETQEDMIRTLYENLLPNAKR